MSAINNAKLDLSGFDNLTMAPAKVYVTHDGKQLEWSGSMGASLDFGFDMETILNGAYRADSFMTLFEVIPEIFAPVNEIATAVSSLEFVLKRFSDDEVIWDNKTFNKLFSNPNPLMDFKQFIWQAIVYEIVTGASLQFINRPSISSANFNNIKSMVNVPTNLACIVPDPLADVYTSLELNELIKEVYTLRPNGSKRNFDIKDLMIKMNLDIECGNKVDKFTSELMGSSMAINNLIPVYMARNKIYVNRGPLGFVYSTKSDASGLVALTKLEKDEVQKELQKMYGVTRQGSLISLMSAPVSFEKTSASIQELEPFKETFLDAANIYNTLRVPRHLMPSEDKPSYDNAKTDMKTFYEANVIPRAKHWAQRATIRLGAADLGYYIDVDASKISWLQPDKKANADTSRIMGMVSSDQFRNSICTLNDWRISAGYEREESPIFDKLLLNMDESELQMIEKYLNLHKNSTNGFASKNQGTQTEVR